MSRVSRDAEEALEQATMELFRDIGWETTNAYNEVHAETPAVRGPTPCLGRTTRHEVVLRPQLGAALARLNPGLPAEALYAAMEELTRERAAMSIVQANQEVYQLLRNGVLVSFQGEDGNERSERVAVVDWNTAANNEFLMVRQLWVSGETYTRRADMVGFINGLPLLFVELKAHHRRMQDAYDGNLRDYKDTIPHLFWYNALVLLSNGSESVMGTITSELEHFSPWKKINDKGEEGVISLETVIRGVCPPQRFLDIVENYILFQGRRGGMAKIAAKYHQFFGVERVIARLGEIEEGQGGKLGVFWHTQGSGKSLSMVFFTEKVLRRKPGNWTFLIVTDRVDLDDQIYKNFARAGAVTEDETRVRAQSGEHLKQLLAEDHRYIFTLIHKFHGEKGRPFPMISDRPDIIVIADEAHRTQYDDLAANMRLALPNARFIAFTATPLMTTEEQKTRDVFGDYVSTYTYLDSVRDRATVPLYYENRVPEVQLVNWALNADMATLLEDAELDDAQEEAVARRFRQAYEVITRDARLDRVARDIVEHFINRGFLGKGMVVSIDKLTSGRMYAKVQAEWQRVLAELRAELPAASADAREALEKQIEFMDSTKMELVVSQEQGEVAKFQARGIDIRPLRARMQAEDLDERFKDPDDPFRLVFVCAMWRTGFDVPSCSTIYLDRPMRNHTLMQTIARANRVFGEKVNGLIVDYVGMFQDVKKALSIYGAVTDAHAARDAEPAEDKGKLVDELRTSMTSAEEFCGERGVALGPLAEAVGFQRIALMDQAVEKLVVTDDLKTRFLVLAGQVNRFYKATLPDPRSGEFGPRRKVLIVLAAKVRALAHPEDMSAILAEIEELLDESVEAREYVIGGGPVYDLSKIDFEALRRRFEQGRQHTTTEELRGAISARLQRMIQRNARRMNYQVEYQRLIDEYNAGSRNIEELFDDLVRLVHSLDEEEQRAAAEQLTEEELAVFDILVQPDTELSASDRRQVKRVVRGMLAKLKAEKLVLDWRDRERRRAAVKVAIRDTLWGEMPESFPDPVVEELSTQVFLHVFDKYPRAGEGVYAGAG